MKTMLKTICSLSAAAACALFCAACEDDGNTMNYNIFPGNELYLPQQGAAVNLGDGQPTLFEWASSVAEDKGFVTYDVLFDKKGGDFSQPAAIQASQLTGSKNYLSLTAKELNAIARQAGIGVGETGELLWTVRASKGLFGSIYTSIHTLTVTRMKSVDPLPTAVTLAGAATEGGDGIPMLLRKEFNGAPIEEAGFFDCFTKISSGEFTVSDELGRYYKLEADGRIVDSDTPAANTMSAEGIYYLTIDFDGMLWYARTVSEVELYAAAWADGMHTAHAPMTYKGKGVWELQNYDNKTSDNSANDSRHRFNMKLGDGTTLYLGTMASRGTSYTTDYMKVGIFDESGIGNADWDKTWKFLLTDCGRPLDCYLYLNADNPAGSYWHEYKFK